MTNKAVVGITPIYLYIYICIIVVKEDACLFHMVVFLHYVSLVGLTLKWSVPKKFQ